MTDKSAKLYHAWFSQKQKGNDNDIKGPIKYPCRNNTCKVQHKRPISSIYITEDGKEIEITEVCEKFSNHKQRFQDSEYRGKVVKWVRAIYN